MCNIKNFLYLDNIGTRQSCLPDSERLFQSAAAGIMLKLSKCDLVAPLNLTGHFK